MTEARYLVCRCTKVTYAFMLGTTADPDKICFYVPWMQEGIKAFVERADAFAYKDKMNNELHDTKPNADGSFTIDTSPATDYTVIDLETRKTIKEE